MNRNLGEMDERKNIADRWKSKGRVLKHTRTPLLFFVHSSVGSGTREGQERKKEKERSHFQSESNLFLRFWTGRVSPVITSCDLLPTSFPCVLPDYVL